MHNYFRRGASFVALFLLLCFSATSCRLPSQKDEQPVSTEETTEAISYNDLYKEVSPSVVTIYSNFSPEMLYDETVSAGSGSGVIFRQDGYIITNFHVIIDDNYDIVSSVEVAFQDGRTFVAKIMGADPLNDIAILKIEETGLPTSEIGSAKDMKVGDPVIVIGSPGAGSDIMQTTLTVGVVSALDRTFEGIMRLQPNLIQIDAAINPGNSGGPVYNSEGKVIGIATLRDPETQNIGFAVPIDVAKRSADAIIKSGTLKRGWIGVDTITIDKVTSRVYQLDEDEGVLVTDIYENSPALKGGMQRGDIITKVDKKKLKSNTQLEDILFNKKINDPIELLVIRAGQETTFNLVIEEVPGGKLE